MAWFRERTLPLLAFLVHANILGSSCYRQGQSATTYIRVDDNGDVSFSYDSTFNLSMSECSMEAYFESYSRVFNFSLFDSTAFTTGDAEPCRFRFLSQSTPHFIRDGKITFSSSDVEFVSKNEYLRTFGLCLRLRTPPHTEMLVGLESVQSWIKSSESPFAAMYPERQGIAMYRKSLNAREIAQGLEVSSSSDGMMLVVAGLYEAFVGHPGRYLTFTLTAVPRCVRSRLEVKHPTHNTTGWSLSRNWLFVTCLLTLCVSTTLVN